MDAIIFSEGNGCGHVGRDRIIAERLGAPIMTFGKGAECCRRLGIEHIEIPAPYTIKTVSQKARITANYSEMLKLMDAKTISLFRRHFAKPEHVIVDGSPVALAAALLLRKKTCFITNDTSSLVGVQDAIGRKAASSALYSLLKAAGRVFVPDFPPPLTVSAENLDPSLGLIHIGPLVGKPEPQRHKKRFIVSGKLEAAARNVLGDDAIYGSEVPDLLPYFRDAEAVICHGGHTTIMEALSFGKPVIAVVDSTYSERVNNADALERLGAGVKIDERSFDEESLRCAVGFIETLEPERLSLFKRTAEAADAAGKLISRMP